MSQSDQQHMLDVLEQQHQNQLKINRVFKVVLPILAFLLAVICANFNLGSTIFTFVMLLVAFLAVGVKQQSLWLWLTALTIYCLADNLLSYGHFVSSAFSKQFGTSMIFLGIIGISRRYMERWLMKKQD